MRHLRSFFTAREAQVAGRSDAPAGGRRPAPGAPALSHTPDIIDTVRALLAEGDIAATPSNYEFWYRYATGADPELVEAVDAARRATGRVTTRNMTAIRRELYGGNGQGTFSRVIEDTARQLERMAGYVGRSEGETRDYRGQLDEGSELLEQEAALSEQRDLLARMMAQTSAMIEKTSILESELASSSSEITTLKADLEIARTESRCDPLTGLANRKAGCDYLEAHVLRAHSELRALSLIFLDIDHFKRFNDSFGHRTGDEVLRLVAQSLERFFHGLGFAARWGGEEFVVVLPGKALAETIALAERFRVSVGSRTVRTRTSQRDIGRITLSLGVAQLAREEMPQQLIDRADRALYDAKADGRDRVSPAPEGISKAA